MNDKEKAISAQRQSVYGDWRVNMEGTSKQLDGLADIFHSCRPSEGLPAWWAPLCMVAVKLNRIASGNFHQDNFDDLRVYLSFLEQMQKDSQCADPSST